MNSITETNTPGTFEVHFTASDPDNDDLFYAISYAQNDDFETIFQAINFTWIEEGSRFTFDANELPGSPQGLIRVSVTDGIHKASAFSSPFEVADQPPIVIINTPSDSSTLASESPITLNGHAFDFEEGMIPETSLIWTSNLHSEPLGTGEYLHLDSLQVGEHTITLSAHDSSQNMVSDSVKINVVEIDNTPDLAVIRLEAASTGFVTNSPIRFTAEVVLAGMETDSDVEYTMTATDQTGVVINTDTINTTIPANIPIEIPFFQSFAQPGEFQIQFEAKLSSLIDKNIGNETLVITATVFDASEDISIDLPTPVPVQTFTPTPTPTQIPSSSIKAFDDLVLAQGFNGDSLVTVRNFDPENGAITRVLRSFRGAPRVFRDAIGGGNERTTYLSTGDVNNDGTEDIVISLGPVTSENALFPNIVLVRDGFSRQIIGHSFNAFPTGEGSPVNYNRGEVRTAVGNFLNNGSNQIATAQGVAGKGVIRLYQFTGQPAPNAWQPVGQFNGLPDNVQNNNVNGGLSIAAGDVNNDGIDELLVSQTNSSSSQTIFHVLTINENGGIASRHPFAGFTPIFRGNGGLELAVADINGDNIAEIIAASKGNTKNFGDARDNVVSNVLSIIQPKIDNGLITGFSRPSNSILNVFSEEINPSGSLSLAVGEMNGNNADGKEIIVGTGALIRVNNDIPEALLPAPTSVYRIIKIGLTEDTVTGISNVIGSNRGFNAFTGSLNPTSGSIWLETLSK